MNKRIVLTALGTAMLCLGQSAGAVISQDADEAETETTDGINASNRIICDRLPPPVGQRFGRGRTVCATQAQWDNYRREARNRLDEAFNRSKVQ